MSDGPHKLTVGQLRHALKDCDPEMAVTFGASRFRRHPLVFYRFHESGEKLLQIELSELEADTPGPSECEDRITVRHLLKGIRGFSDDSEITFGFTGDAVPLEFMGIEPVMAINLTQTQQP